MTWFKRRKKAYYVLQNGILTWICWDDEVISSNASEVKASIVISSPSTPPPTINGIWNKNLSTSLFLTQHRGAIIFCVFRCFLEVAYNCVTSAYTPQPTAPPSLPIKSKFLKKGDTGSLSHTSWRSLLPCFVCLTPYRSHSCFPTSRIVHISPSLTFSNSPSFHSFTLRSRSVRVAYIENFLDKQKK